MSSGLANRALAAVALVAIGGVALAGPAAAATNSGTPGAKGHSDPLQQQVDAIQEAGAVGVLASVTTARGTRSARAGVADTASSSPVPLDAEFRIGSATKSFVATVVLQLVGEHRLSLSDTVAQWLPGVVEGNGNDGTRITVRELLQHTSGIYDYLRDTPVVSGVAGYEANRMRTYTPQELVALAMQHPPYFAPGAGMAYSNTNYVLLGMIIDRVTGHSWSDEVHARIIAPLGLRHTSTPGTFPFIDGPHAEGYSGFGGPDLVEVTLVNPTVADAAGSMISTTRDLSRFYRALVGGGLLAPAQLAEMEAAIPVAQLDAIWPGAAYGLGLAWFPLPCGGGYYGHPGDVPGFHTWDAATQDGRTVVVSVTGDSSEGTQLAVNALVEQELCRAD
ncbi:MAG TPA: serine hydrolase domain-containing protein [Actinocrinis sp.]|nr:serine hydrolase domain-containing protein [Actinocrinis sp.]